eukprot:5839396-Prorocentrum_lima.AAC.1
MLLPPSAPPWPSAAPAPKANPMEKLPLKLLPHVPLGVGRDPPIQPECLLSFGRLLLQLWLCLSP